MSAAPKLVPVEDIPFGPPSDPQLYVGRAMSRHEWGVLIDRTGVKYERQRGRIVLPPQGMAGPTRKHNKTADNVQSFLDRAFRDRGDDCTSYRADQAVYAPELDRDTFPDVVASRGDEEFAEGDEDRVLLNPVLAVEVLSPSTRGFDRDEKFAGYRSIPSLSEYLVVDPDRAAVELFRRQEGGWLMQPLTGLDAVARLESVGVDLPLAEVYRLVEPASRERQ